MFYNLYVRNFRKLKLLNPTDMIEQTLILLKPDAVKRGLVGEIIGRFEKVGLKIAAAKMIWANAELLNQHYPPSRKEFVIAMGEKTLANNKQAGVDTKAVWGND